MERIEKINEHLKKIGSSFRTDDGKNLVMFVGAKSGEIKFLRRSFESISEMEKFVFSV